LNSAARRAFAEVTPDFVRRLDIHLRPDPTLVVLREFIPMSRDHTGNPGDETRVQRIISRVLDDSPASSAHNLRRVLRGFADRHRDVQSFFLGRFEKIAKPYVGDRLLTLDQQLLIGAYFSHEYSYQAAALFNPSIVPHPDQADVGEGRLRVLMSLRAVGEGHVSSVCFRTGSIDGKGLLRLDNRHESALSSIVTSSDGDSMSDGAITVYCAPDHPPDESVIYPVTRAQSNGIEDLRLVQFTEEDGRTTYYGTYTAYSGSDIASEMLATDDFTTFCMLRMTGDASRSKGMALFPRRINGRYAMLGRQDNENIWLLYSDDITNWNGGDMLLTPRYPWEFTQIGNCGSPIEVDEGWLVLSHGVGPVRNYSIGAFLLDKDDPSRVLARTPEPIIRPNAQEREGYVPNVVYSCGGLVHGRTLVLPYAIADSITTVATMDVGRLIAHMV
jgi:predicted GH43/DUF377 family glycosyl hydrolase